MIRLQEISSNVSNFVFIYSSPLSINIIIKQSICQNRVMVVANVKTYLRQMRSEFICNILGGEIYSNIRLLC